jgi:hypothetical protein
MLPTLRRRPGRRAPAFRAVKHPKLSPLHAHQYGTAPSHSTCTRRVVLYTTPPVTTIEHLQLPTRFCLPCPFQPSPLAISTSARPCPLHRITPHRLFGQWRARHPSYTERTGTRQPSDTMHARVWSHLPHPHSAYIPLTKFK